MSSIEKDAVSIITQEPAHLADTIAELTALAEKKWWAPGDTHYMRNALPELLAELKELTEARNDLAESYERTTHERNAALARAEKAEAKLESVRDWGRKKHEELEELKCDRRADLAHKITELEQVKAERDWLAEQCENLALTKKEVWLEEATQQAAKRESSEV